MTTTKLHFYEPGELSDQQLLDACRDIQLERVRLATGTAGALTCRLRDGVIVKAMVAFGGHIDAEVLMDDGDRIIHRVL